MNMNFIYLILTTLATLALIPALTMLTKHSSMMIEWTILESNCNSMSFTMMMDWKSAFFMSTVLLISGSVVLYSKFYMPPKDVTKFTKIIMTFVSSMILLILSPNMISMIMGWEGLGMSSFILIMHFKNKKSLMSSIFTMIMNRLGDIMLMISMMIIMNINSWTFLSIMLCKPEILLTTLTMSLFSKSAQIPFSSWLTEAMAAPTPVSALVHSSTLVTAGVYIMIRMELSIKYTKITELILTVATMTLLMASMNATLEWDVKKIVALSTLTQLSTMFIAIAINMFKMAAFHMLMHAMFKALIFICSSSLISLANSQDIRQIKMTIQASPTTMISMTTANLTLCGMMFTSGFYSKEIIIEMMVMNKINYPLMLTFSLCMCVTMFYSMKLIFFTSTIPSNNTMKINHESKTQVASKIMILTPSIILGNKMNWMINLTTKIPIIKQSEKMMPLTIMIITMIMMKEIYSQNKMKKMKSKMLMIAYMWFMKNMSINTKMIALYAAHKTYTTSETGNLNKMTKIIKNKMKTTTTNKFYSITKSFKMILLIMVIMTTTLMF